tara:strand:- start:54 stop:440 length:387 start_codon:yes stop_codon:yes gene_type:complete
MVRLIGNVLVFGLAILFLNSCAAVAVKELQSYKIEKKREPLNIPNPEPLSLVDVEWIVVTKDNVDEVMEKVKAEGGDYALFAVTDEGYKKLSLNFADIRNKLHEQNQIILSYKEYYEDGEREQSEGTD